MLRQLFVITLLALICIGLAGYYPVFKFSQWKVRKEIKASLKKKIPADKLHVIESPEAGNEQFVWEEELKEFRYQGNLYDVVFRDTVNGVVRFHCINDREEEALFAKLDNLVENELTAGKGSTSQNALRLLKFCNTLIFLPSEKFTVSFTSTSVRNAVYESGCLSGGYPGKVVHPPQG